MQPIFQSIEHSQLAKMLSPTHDKFIQVGEDKLYAATSGDKNTNAKQVQQSQINPNLNHLNLVKAKSLQQKQFELPQILDISKTQQTRLRQSTIKHTIESTIQQLLYVYKHGSSSLTPAQQEKLKNDIFQRFAFIYSEMNEVKGDIQNTITFLNEGVATPQRQRQTLVKRINLPNTRISQKSQGFQQSSQMKEDQDQCNNQQNSDQNYGQPSLEERCHEKDQNSMEREE